jgi:hypothetical protein
MPIKCVRDQQIIPCLVSGINFMLPALNREATPSRQNLVSLRIGLASGSSEVNRTDWHKVIRKVKGFAPPLPIQ